MQDKIKEICEEVTALIDRMDKFPEEFIASQMHSKWYKVSEALNLSEDDSPFTVAEYRALHKKLHDLRRYEIKQSILKAIVHVEDERKEPPSYAFPDHRALAVQQKLLGGTVGTLGVTSNALYSSSIGVSREDLDLILDYKKNFKS
jgi:hypothetical protein